MTEGDRDPDCVPRHDDSYFGQGLDSDNTFINDTQTKSNKFKPT